MIRLNRSELAAAASVAAKMALVRAGVHQGWQEARLTCSDGRLTLTAMDSANRVEISVACEGDIEAVCIHATRFAEVLAALPAETVEIEVEGARLRIAGGRGKRSLAISPAASFPDPEFHPTNTLKFPGDRLREALDFTLPHIADPADVTKRNMSGVHLVSDKGRLRAIGTDAYEMGIFDVCATADDIGLTINPRVAEFVARLIPDGECTLRLSERMAEFSWDGCLIRGPLVEDMFPIKAVDHALGKEYEHAVSAEADAFLKALQSIRWLGEMDSMSRSRRIKLTLNGCGVVRTQSGEGSAEQEFPADWQGDERAIGFAGARMDRILRHFGDAVLTIGIRDDESALKIEAAGQSDRLCLLFPLRI